MSGNRRPSIPNASPSNPSNQAHPPQRRTSGYRQDLPTIPAGYAQHVQSHNNSNAGQHPHFHPNSMNNAQVHMQALSQPSTNETPQPRQGTYPNVPQPHSHSHSQSYHHSSNYPQEIDDDGEDGDLDGDQENEEEDQMLLDDASDRETVNPGNGESGGHVPKKRKYSLTDPQGSARSGGNGSGKGADGAGAGQGQGKEKKRRQVQSCSECRRRWVGGSSSKDSACYREDC